MSGLSSRFSYYSLVPDRFSSTFQCSFQQTFLSPSFSLSPPFFRLPLRPLLNLLRFFSPFSTAPPLYLLHASSIRLSSISYVFFLIPFTAFHRTMPLYRSACKTVGFFQGRSRGSANRRIWTRWADTTRNRNNLSRCLRVYDVYYLPQNCRIDFRITKIIKII